MKHRQQINSDGIIGSLSEKKGMSVEEVRGAFMMILFGGMYEDSVGKKTTKKSTRLLVRGIVEM